MLLAVSRSLTEKFGSSNGLVRGLGSRSEAFVLGFERPQQASTPLAAIWTRTLQRLTAFSATLRLTKFTKGTLECRDYCHRLDVRRLNPNRVIEGPDQRLVRPVRRQRRQEQRHYRLVL
jgi:hypothetical protein